MPKPLEQLLAEARDQGYSPEQIARIPQVYWDKVVAPALTSQGMNPADLAQVQERFVAGLPEIRGKVPPPGQEQAQARYAADQARRGQPITPEALAAGSGVTTEPPFYADPQFYAPFGGAGATAKFAAKIPRATINAGKGLADRVIRNITGKLGTNLTGSEVATGFNEAGKALNPPPTNVIDSFVQLLKARPNPAVDPVLEMLSRVPKPMGVPSAPQGAVPAMLERMPSSASRWSGVGSPLPPPAPETAADIVRRVMNTPQPSQLVGNVPLPGGPTMSSTVDSGLLRTSPGFEANIRALVNRLRSAASGGDPTVPPAFP